MSQEKIMVALWALFMTSMVAAILLTPIRREDETE